MSLSAKKADDSLRQRYCDLIGNFKYVTGRLKGPGEEIISRIGSPTVNAGF